MSTALGWTSPNQGAVELKILVCERPPPVGAYSIAGNGQLSVADGRPRPHRHGGTSTSEHP